MKRYYCKPSFDVPQHNVYLVEVREGQTLHAGQIVALSTLANTSNTHRGNVQVYDAGAVSNAKKDMYGIVINYGHETLSDGRRPDGNTDFTTYEFKAGDVVTVVALDNWMRFEISHDALGSVLVDNETYLNATSDSFDLTTAGAPLSKVYFRVEKYNKTLRAGGAFGSDFINTAVIVAFVGDNIA